MAIVYSYVRFSRPEQMNGDSIRRQTQRTLDWCERNGHTLDSSLELRDLGVPAFKGLNAKQGALAVFLECIRTGRVAPGSILVTENIDRITRQKVGSSYGLITSITNQGVQIVTLEPERVYSSDTLNDFGTAVELMVYLCRAHDESARKSDRGGQVWENKRKNAATVPLTSICPEWLRYDKDAKTFHPIATRVETVQRIYRMAQEGFGTVAITKTLNRESVPTFGRSTAWARSSIKKILSNRAVLGEFQPHSFTDGKRVPIGAPVPNYFPAIISEADFHAAQRSIRERRSKGGKHGGSADEDKLTNLFTGLIRDARDGSPMGLVDKGDGHRLVSSAARNGVKGAVYLSFPYADFEKSLLIWGYNLPLADVIPRQPTNLEADIAKAQGERDELAHKIAALQESMRKAGADVSSLADMVVEFDAERKRVETTIERLKQQAATPEANSLNGLRELISRMQGRWGGIKPPDKEEVYRLRVKLRALLRRLIEDIVLLVVQVGRVRVALVDVKFKNGTRRQLTVTPPGERVNLPAELRDRDIRRWTKWPKELQEPRFELPSELTQEMLALNAQGLERKEIANRLGVSLSRVSRTLIRAGSRKRPRKRAGDPRKMTWHAAGNGWIKRHKGQRYFVGMGTLAELFPKLVKARTADGSWRAANAWWERKLNEIGG